MASISTDLQIKFAEAFNDAIFDYVEELEKAGHTGHTIDVEILSYLSLFIVKLGKATGLSKERFIEAVGKCWDQVEGFGLPSLSKNTLN